MASSVNPRDRRRSKRVALGMRVTVIAEDHERRRRQCPAMTQVVNARGGLMRIETEPHVGHPMLLGNPQNNAEQACRVVRVDDAADGDFAVACEFAAPHLNFWPVVFPPEDSMAASVRQARKTRSTRNSFRLAVFDRLSRVSVRRTMS